VEKENNIVVVVVVVVVVVLKVLRGGIFIAHLQLLLFKNKKRSKIAKTQNFPQIKTRTGVFRLSFLSVTQYKL